MSSALVKWDDPRAASIEDQMMQLAPRFADVLGGLVRPERLIRTVMVSLEKTPKLFDCDRQSIFNAAMTAACLALEVDGVTGQGFLLPFKGKAQFITGYKGYNTLAARGGFSIVGDVIREGEKFRYDKANRIVEHEIPLAREGRIIGAWAKADSKTLPSIVEVVGIDELMTLKSRAPGGARAESPWNDPVIGFPAMCGKTAKRRLGRSMPMNVLQVAARLDEAVEEQGRHARVTPERGLIVDAEIEEVESPLPPRQNEPPISISSPSLFPELSAELAQRAASLKDFIEHADSVARVETRWNRAESLRLREQIKIVSGDALARLGRIYKDRRSELKKEAEARA